MCSPSIQGPLQDSGVGIDFKKAINETGRPRGNVSELSYFCVLVNPPLFIYLYIVVDDRSSLSYFFLPFSLLFGF